MFGVVQANCPKIHKKWAAAEGVTYLSCTSSDAGCLACVNQAKVGLEQWLGLNPTATATMSADGSGHYTRNISTMEDSIEDGLGCESIPNDASMKLASFMAKMPHVGVRNANCEVRRVLRGVYYGGTAEPTKPAIEAELGASSLHAVDETVILLHPPSTFSRRFNRDKKGVPSIGQSRRRLRCTAFAAGCIAAC